MDPVMAACINTYRTNDTLLAKALDGLTDDDAWKHPGDANPIYWIAGHIVVYRHRLATLLGVGNDWRWGEIFKRTSQPDRSVEGPSLAEIHEALLAPGEPLAAKLAELTELDLSPTAPVRLPTQDPSVRGMIAFFAYHESYHVGQMAYLKKWLGFPGIVDGQ